MSKPIVCGPGRVRDGQTMVELAIVLPILVVIVSTLIDLALVANAQMTLHRLTASVASDAIQYQDGRYWTESEVRDALQNRLLPPLTRDRLTITKAKIEVDATGHRFVSLSVNYDVPLFTPGLSMFLANGSARISSADRSTYVEPSPPPPIVVAAAPFVIAADGSIEVQSSSSARVKVLAKSFKTSNGTDVPIFIDTSDDGLKFSNGFANNAVSSGDEMSLSGLQPGKKVALKATAKLRGRDAFDASYASNAKDAFADNATMFHQYVLGNGDSTPDNVAFNGPPALGPALEPFVDTRAKAMKLGKKDVAVLWEFNQNYASNGTDYQDVVVLVQFYDPGTESRPMTP